MREKPIEGGGDKTKQKKQNNLGHLELQANRGKQPSKG